MGIFISPRPPLLRGVLTQAKWENSESQEQARTAVLRPLKRSMASEKAIISVGQTKLLLFDSKAQTGLLDCVIRSRTEAQSGKGRRGSSAHVKAIARARKGGWADGCAGVMRTHT